jgi:cyclohexa-1,5-dienecarbonyl-CoA hydratase
MPEAVDVRRGPDGWVRLVFSERPGNVLSLALVKALRRTLASVGGIPAMKLLTLEGDGADFSFGASIPEHLPDRIGPVLVETHALLRDLLRVPAPTAAIVRGRCLGGGFELALACDFIFAAEDATLGLPEVALGVFPPAGSALLPLRVGVLQATRTILTGAPLSGGEWRDIGLVTLTATAEELEASVQQWFDANLAARSATALRYAAEAARFYMCSLGEPAIDRAERVYLDRLMRTHDAHEGIAAFIEKRAPAWKDA